MCRCEYQPAWTAVFEQLQAGGNNWLSTAGNGQQCAVNEIRRLQSVENRDRVDSLRKEIDEVRRNSSLWAQVDRAEAAEKALQRELEKHTETLKMLEAERIKCDGVEAELAATLAVKDCGGRDAAHRANMERIRDGRGIPENGKQIAAAIIYTLDRVAELQK